jgi:hypothetical protein
MVPGLCPGYERGGLWHFGQRFGDILIGSLLVFLWIILVLWLINLRRRTRDGSYRPQQTAWLKREVENDLATEEDEVLVWHGFPAPALAAEDARHMGYWCLWDEPSGGTRCNPCIEIGYVVLLFTYGHCLAALFFFDWRDRYDNCPWPYSTMAVLALSALLVGTMVPFVCERFMRKATPMCAYAVTNYRAFMVLAPWIVWAEEDCQIEVPP